MRNLFGRRKKKVSETKKYVEKTIEVKTSEHTISIGRVKHTIETLKKRLTLLETKIKHELSKATSFKSQNKTKDALICLKRKKIYEKEHDKLQNTIFTLERQILSLESSIMTSEMIDTQTMVKSSLEKIQSAVNIDEVTELQDSIQESVEENEEVNRMLGENQLDNFDDDELSNELDALLADNGKVEENKVSEKISATEDESVGVEDLPQAPSTKVEIKKTEEEELQKLTEEMLLQK